ncbi:Fanconi anemia core complex-associated protein 24 isoform X2 [Lissotriton helveticus]
MVEVRNGLQYISYLSSNYSSTQELSLHRLTEERNHRPQNTDRRARKIQLHFEEALGMVDFQLPNRMCILYISEADLVAGNAFKRRLVRIRNGSHLHALVIVERTRLSEQYFSQVQKFIALELGMNLLPVANQSEAAQLIIQLVQSQSKEQQSNPFLRKKRSQLAEPSILNTIQQIPGVGKVKALLLLQYFPSIHQLSKASVQQLEEVVGRGIAQQVHTFFTQQR